MISDLDLLQSYARQNSQDAFAALVGRHLNLVYSAALRQVRSPQLAEEVSQSVFADLSRNATTLKPDTILTAWLYQVTRRTAIDVVRRESRRQLREQIAVEINAMNATATDWKDIEPMLDEAVSALDDPDRTAVLLRYFENKSLRDVGLRLGISEDAAQKRVTRAVERLRELFTKRNVTIGTVSLAIIISANAVQAAPAGMAVGISTFIANTAITTATHTTMNLLSLKALSAILGLALVTATTVHLLEHREIKRLESEKRDLVVQTENLKNQLQEAEAASTTLKKQAEQLQVENSDLVRLRKQVSALRRQIAESPGQSSSLPSIVSETSRAVSTDAAPTFLSPEEGMNKCLNNLRQIDAAMQQCALEKNLSPTNIITAEDILLYLPGNKLPQCPSGGTYSFGSLTNAPTCSIPGHSLTSQSPANELAVAPVITAIMQDYNGHIPSNDLTAAHKAFQQDHPDQAVVELNDLIPYLPNPGPRLLAAEQNFVRNHGRMPANGLELAPYFPSSPQN